MASVTHNLVRIVTSYVVNNYFLLLLSCLYKGKSSSWLLKAVLARVLGDIIVTTEPHLHKPLRKTSFSNKVEHILLPDQVVSSDVGRDDDLLPRSIGSGDDSVGVYTSRCFVLLYTGVPGITTDPTP